MINLAGLGISNESLVGMNMHVPTGAKGRVLLYDADGACYQHSAGVKKLQTAQNRLEKDVLTMMYLAKCESARIHLTPKGCLKNNRHLLLGAKPYQANRGTAKKPEFLEMLRDSAPHFLQDHPDITVLSHYDIEADDGLMMDVYSMDNGVLISPDKDLLISPKEQYVVNTGEFLKLPDGERFGWIKDKVWNTPSGKVNSKCVGKGVKFYLAQLLMGDTADNVQGILRYKGKLCGKAGALAALGHVQCEHEAVNLVLDGYREIDQNIIPEAFAMWLLRYADDNAYKYFLESELTSENRAFLDDCYFNRKWTLTQEEYSDMTQEQYHELFKK